MMLDVRRIFNPTPEEHEEDIERWRKLHQELCQEKGCGTCRNCKHVRSFPGYITGEECDCAAGLKCDTVLFSVKNCEKYNQKEFDEFLYGKQK